jgi:hypothetical protein
MAAHTSAFLQWLQGTKLDPNDPDHIELLELQKLAQLADVSHPGSGPFAVNTHNAAHLRPSSHSHKEKLARWRSRWQVATAVGGMGALLLRGMATGGAGGAPPVQAGVEGQQLMLALRIRSAKMHEHALLVRSMQAELALAPAGR